MFYPSWIYVVLDLGGIEVQVYPVPDIQWITELVASNLAWASLNLLC